MRGLDNIIGRLFGASVAVCCVSCAKYDLGGMIAGSGPDANARFAESAAYNEANGFRQFQVDKEDYRYHVAADAHVSDTGEGLAQFVECILSDSEAAPFALFLGDMSEGKGGFGNFFRITAPLVSSGTALFQTPGNHDIHFGMWPQYIQAAGTATYLFEVVTPAEKKDLFICLDSSDGTLGTKQRAWLGATLAAAAGKYRHKTVFTHTPFFRLNGVDVTSAAFNQEESYDLAKLFADSGVELVLCGHNHKFSQTRFKGVLYMTLAPVSDEGGRHSYVINPGEASSPELLQAEY